MCSIKNLTTIVLCVICLLNMQFSIEPVELLLRVQHETLEFPFVEEDVGVLFIIDSNEHCRAG